MKAIVTEHTNSVLMAPENQKDEVADLPIARVQFQDGTRAVESCWELSKEEIEEVKRTGRVYFVCMGDTHPPIVLRNKSLLEEVIK